MVGEGSDKNRKSMWMSQYVTTQNHIFIKPCRQILQDSGWEVSSLCRLLQSVMICHGPGGSAICQDAADHIVLRQQRNQLCPSLSGINVKHWREALLAVNTVFIWESVQFRGRDEMNIRWYFRISVAKFLVNTIYRSDIALCFLRLNISHPQIYTGTLWLLQMTNSVRQSNSTLSYLSLEIVTNYGDL